MELISLASRSPRQPNRQTLAKQMSGQKTQETLKSTPIAKETQGHIRDIKTSIESFKRKETGEAGSVTEKIIKGQEPLRMRKKDGDRSGLHQDCEGNSTETT